MTTQCEGLIEQARRLAEANRTEGWNGNDCDEAMRCLNALASRCARLEKALKPYVYGVASIAEQRQARAALEKP